MFENLHHPSRVLVRSFGCLMLLLGPPSSAQEYTPVANDLVDGEVFEPLLEDEFPPLEEDDAEQRGGWEIGVIVSAAYDDNVFLSARNPEEDMVFRLAPVIAYTQGDSEEGVGGFVTGGYRPTVVVYSENSSDSRIDHEALLEAGWRGQVTRVTYEGKARVLGDSTAETGRPTDRFEFDNEVRAAWIPREKVIWEGAIGYDRRDYQDEFYFDSDKVYGEVTVRYLYSPKTELGLAYQVGRFDVDGGGPQYTNQVTGSMRWQPREKIRVNIEAGAEYRDLDNGSEFNPVLAGRVDWEPRKETAIYVTAYMRQETSAFFAGQNYSIKGVTAGVSQRLGGDWTLRVDGGYESNEYEQVSGTGTADRSDVLWFIEPALVWKLNEETELAFFYRMSDNDSNDPSFGYERQIFGVLIDHKF